MKINHHNLVIAAAGLFLFAASAAAQNDSKIYQNSTNRFTFSARFGLNISAKFKGIGGNLNPSKNPGQYDDGYVHTDVSGNAGGQTWYWGYDNSSQINAGNNTVSFDRTTATANGNSSTGNEDSGVTTGFELAYRQLGVVTTSYKF